jgi:hypothetical protein
MAADFPTVYMVCGGGGTSGRRVGRGGECEIGWKRTRRSVAAPPNAQDGLSPTTLADTLLSVPLDVRRSMYVGALSSGGSVYAAPQSRPDYRHRREKLMGYLSRHGSPSLKLVAFLAGVGTTEECLHGILAEAHAIPEATWLLVQYGFLPLRFSGGESGDDFTGFKIRLSAVQAASRAHAEAARHAAELSARDAEIASLRAEVERLRLATLPSAAGGGGAPAASDGGPEDPPVSKSIVTSTAPAPQEE